MTFSTILHEDFCRLHNVWLVNLNLYENCIIMKLQQNKCERIGSYFEHPGRIPPPGGKLAR